MKFGKDSGPVSGGPQVLKRGSGFAEPSAGSGGIGGQEPYGPPVLKTGSGFAGPSAGSGGIGGQELHGPPVLIAGIDIGTNTLRLLIADIEGHGLNEVRIERRITRLGEGISRSDNLLPHAIERTIKTLKEFYDIIRLYPVQEVTAVGTSAVRSARNRNRFLRRVQDETGLTIEVISGEEEAQRTFLGIASGLKKGAGDFLILDIGGGSTEFIWGVEDRLSDVHSAPLGVVPLTEAFLLSDPTRPEEVERLSEAVRVSLRKIPFFQGREKSVRLVGTAGTVTTLAAMVQGLNHFDRSKVHNYRLTGLSIDRILSLVLGKTLAERRKLPGLEAGREDVIVAGAVILLRVMELLKVTAVEVSDCGLLEGIVIHHGRRVGLIPM